MENNILNSLSAKIRCYLEQLCCTISNRHTGSEGNRKATDFAAKVLKTYGFEVNCPQFDCIDWECGEVNLYCQGNRWPAYVSPYSLPCDAATELVTVGSIAELKHKMVTGKILLLHGEIAKEQLMPKNFSFYNPDQHREIYSLLETAQPAALICATERNPETAGGVYPFPMFEDGDFNIPSVYLTSEVGNELLTAAGETVKLAFSSSRIPATGCNVVASKGNSHSGKIVFCAHIDAKKSTPGALDNASGVATLLALSELLSDYTGTGVELLLLNGEDYYAASGQMLYLADNHSNMNEITLAINLDAVGFKEGGTAFSCYQLSPDWQRKIHELFSVHHGLVEGPPWYQSDHMIFVQHGCPALAFISEASEQLFGSVIHTADDRMELVSPFKLASLAFILKELLLSMHQLSL